MRFSDIRAKSAVGFFAAALTVLGASGVQAAAVEGTWKTLNGSEIQIQPCGEQYCGTLSWIVIPAAQADMCRSMDKEVFASLMLDYNNTDQTLQTRPLLGVQMVTLTPAGNDESYTATIYNAQDGQSYDVLIWIINGDTLRLGGGCVASMCAVTQDWARVPDREAPDFTCEGGL